MLKVRHKRSLDVGMARLDCAARRDRRVRLAGWVLLLVTVLPLGACDLGLASKAREMRTESTTQESITSVLVSPGQRQLILLGHGHHFVFELHDSAQLAALSNRQMATLSSVAFSHVSRAGWRDGVELGEANRVSGDLDLTISADSLSELNIASLQAQGFVFYRGPPSYLSRRAAITGTLYLPRKTQDVGVAAVARPFQLTLATPSGVAGKTAGLLLMPLAMGADLTAMIVSGSLIIVGGAVAMNVSCTVHQIHHKPCLLPGE